MRDDKLNVVLENNRVLLRPLAMSDEAELQVLANDRELWTYGLTDLSQPGELNHYVRKAIEAREEGTCAVWTIIDKQTNSVAGCTRLAEISWKDERGQIGWTWIGKEYQGSGLNKAMKFLILQYGFEELMLNRIELKADERNIRSREAIKRIGATEEGILRQHMKIHDGYLRNSVFYSILRSEWDEIRTKFFQQY
ncbi:GNAT family N-acetyltransferase [Flavihumibacter sp. R14]|nr:GNAT family N-acetyltransferase [Flavihumibacter soli]